jgi:uncharacterized membrane protein
MSAMWKDPKILEWVKHLGSQKSDKKGTMAEMTPETKRKLRIFKWIIIVAIILPLIPYLINFRKHDWSPNPADWANFGDYLGGTLGPVLGILTLVVTIYIAIELNKIEERRRKESDEKSYKPQILFDESIFHVYSSKSEHSDKYVPLEFSYERKSPSYVSNQQSILPFGLNAYNVGLGPCKKAEAVFEIDVPATIKLITELNNDQPLQYRIRVSQSLDHILISLGFDPQLAEAFHIPISQHIRQQVNLILPLSARNTPYPIPLPSYILYLYSAFIMAIRHIDEHTIRALNVQFPIIKGTITYQDIADKSYTKEMNIRFKYVVHYGHEYMTKLEIEEI